MHLRVKVSEQDLSTVLSKNDNRILQENNITPKYGLQKPMADLTVATSIYFVFLL